MNKNNKVTEIIKSIVLVAVMTIFAYGIKQANIVNAATTDTIIYEEKDISQYRENREEYIAPQREGYIFGGWYKDQSEYLPLSDEITTGKAYAKFVPEDVLTVLCQNSQGTDSNTNMTNVRLVTSTDSDLYQKIGFDIEICGTKKTKYNYETSKVYKSIKISNGSDMISVSADKNFSKVSKYFVTVKMTHIPNAGYNTAFLIRPYWITLDGTKVYGLDRYARVRNGYDGSFSVPIRIWAPEKLIAASFVDIGYDNSELEFEGYDSGNLFDEYSGRENNGSIKILGNVKSMDKNVAADGMLVSLNFRVKDYDVVEKTYSFQLNKIDFCNINESRINVGKVTLKSVTK